MRTIRVPILCLFATTVSAMGAASCGGNEPEPQAPVAVAPKPEPAKAPPPKPTGPDLSAIPPPGAPKPLEPKPVFELETKQGLKVVGIEARELPVVHVRVVVRAGNAASVLAATNGTSRAGIANVVAELMKDGGAGKLSPRALAEKIDLLGTDLGVEVGPDRVVFGLAVTKDKLDEALELLGAIVTKPKFDAGEFAKLKARELDRVRQSQKGSGSWIARTALYRELYGQGHPYADIDANDESLQKIDLADVKGFYKKNYTVGNAFVVVAGDVDRQQIAQKIEKHFGALPKGEAPALPWKEPPASDETRVILAKRAGSKQADILVGRLAIPRKDPKWPELALAVHALGGGMAARLFTDVREKRSLAYSTQAVTRELAHGPAVLALYAGTQTPQAPKSVTALLENLQWISGGQPIEGDELAIAKSSLETGFLFRLETIGAVAGLEIDKRILDLPGKDVYGHVEQYRKALRDAPLDAVRTIASKELAPKGWVIAVAGDPALAGPLRRFGPVRVVDPENGFQTLATHTADPAAPLDVPASGAAGPTSTSPPSPK